MSKFKGYINLSKDDDIIYNNFLVRGISYDDKIIYKENDITVTILFLGNTIKMKRESSDYIIEMNFSDKNSLQGIYYLKEHKKSVNLYIKNIKYKNDNNKIYLDYNLSLEDEKIGHFTFYLEFEVES